MKIIHGLFGIAFLLFLVPLAILLDVLTHVEERKNADKQTKNE